MGEEKYNDTQLLKKSPAEINIKEQRAFFYHLLAKPDSVTKVYNKSTVIDIDDIYELNERVVEKLGHYQEAGFIIQINIKFADGKTKVFPDWKAFSSHKWFEAEAINNITITWEFNAIFPGMQVPERHTLMVKLSNRLRPEELLNLVFTGKIEEIEELDQNLFPIIARVDFVDRTLGDELLNIVSEWVKSLRESPVKKSKFMFFLKKNKGVICTLLSWITNIVVMFASVIVTGQCIFRLNFNSVLDINKEQMITIIYMVFGCSAVWIFGKRLIGALTDFLYEKLREYGENALFDITKGDHNKQYQMKDNERSRKLAVLWNLFVTIVINIACGIAVNILS